MTRVSERICGWLGWCPDSRTHKTSRPRVSVAPIENQAILSDGGSSGSERIGNGIDFAIKSIKILVQNRELLWFSCLFFLTFIVSMVTNLYIQEISGINAFPGVMNFQALLWVALTFAMAFIANFVFFYLAAGLVICVSHIPTGNSIAVREGLSRAWHYKRPIAGWTLIGALLWIPIGLFIYGFFMITVFALPAILLDNKDLTAAIRESIFKFQRIWVETYVSFGMIVLVSIGFVFVALFSIGQIGVAYGLSDGGSIVSRLISLVVPALMAIGLVVLGITLFTLYSYEKKEVPIHAIAHE
jgi:hypothetical protein